MTTHGTILVRPSNSKTGIWLHAYSDGHTHDAFETLKALPKLFVDRVALSRKLHDPSLGKGWVIDQWDPAHWKSCLSVCFSAHPPMIASLIVQSHFGRWNPILEEDIPYHDLGELPELTVVCDCNLHGYTIIPRQDVLSDEEDYVIQETYVPFMDDLYKQLDALAKAKGK